jgi:uncharacterized protein (TIGR00251 family)
VNQPRGATAAVTVTARAVRIAIRVQPRSSRDRVVGLRGGVLKVQVTAPPVHDAANRAVVALLADWLGVPRSALAVVRGHAARDKLVEVASDDPGALARAVATRVDNLGGAD